MKNETIKELNKKENLRNSQRNIQSIRYCTNKLIRNFRGIVRSERTLPHHMPLSSPSYHAMSSISELFPVHLCAVQIFLIGVNHAHVLFLLAIPIYVRLTRIAPISRNPSSDLDNAFVYFSQYE